MTSGGSFISALEIPRYLTVRSGFGQDVELGCPPEPPNAAGASRPDESQVTSVPDVGQLFLIMLASCVLIMSTCNVGLH